tara:strand:- start:32 stop:229 length:198 start_codon:yes stop_codon:yes gene_type:complete
MDQITPTITTTKEIITTLKDLKNRNKRAEVTNRANRTNNVSSDLTIVIMYDLINGSPENFQFLNK